MMRTPTRNRRGFTLFEVLVSTSVLALMLACIISMWVSAVRRCETDLAQMNTDTSAVIAMQRMVGDIREAETVTILAGGAQLCIVQPVRVSQTQGRYYDRSTPDTAEPINYYLSDSTGIIGRTGSACTILWRQQIKGGVTTTLPIRNNIDPQGLVFETDAADTTHIDSIQITIKTKDNVSHEAMKKNIDTVGVYTQLTDRVVYLRNYQSQ